MPHDTPAPASRRGRLAPRRRPRDRRRGSLHAERVGKAHRRSRSSGPSAVLYGGTRRTRETAEAIVRGIGDPARIDGPLDSFALRNPDMYVAGTRVNMVSSPETLAEQVPGHDDRAGRGQPVVERTSSPHPTGSAGGCGQERPTGRDRRRPDRPHHPASPAASPTPVRSRGRARRRRHPLAAAALGAPRAAPASDPGEPGYVTGADVRVSADADRSHDHAVRPARHPDTTRPTHSKGPRHGTRPRLHRPRPRRPGLGAADRRREDRTLPARCGRHLRRRRRLRGRHEDQARPDLDDLQGRRRARREGRRGTPRGHLQAQGPRRQGQRRRPGHRHRHPGRARRRHRRPRGHRPQRHRQGRPVRRRRHEGRQQPDAGPVRRQPRRQLIQSGRQPTPAPPAAGRSLATAAGSTASTAAAHPACHGHVHPAQRRRTRRHGPAPRLRRGQERRHARRRSAPSGSSSATSTARTEPWKGSSVVSSDQIITINPATGAGDRHLRHDDRRGHRRRPRRGHRSAARPGPAPIIEQRAAVLLATAAAAA